MIVLKKCVAKNRLSVTRKKSRHPFRELGQAGRADSCASKPARPMLGGRPFAEDFTREHAFPVSQDASIEMSGTF